MDCETSSPSSNRKQKIGVARNRAKIRVQAKQIDALRALAQARGISPSKVVREALLRHLTEYQVFLDAAANVADPPIGNALHAQDAITAYVNGQDILGDPNDCVKVISLEGNVHRWNTNLERLLGYRSEDMPIQVRELVSIEARESFGTLLARVILGESITEVETQLIHKEGYLVDVSISLFPWRDQGGVTGVVAISRDLSALKRRERDAAYVATVAHACNSAVSGALLLADIAKLTAGWANAARIFTANDDVSHLISSEIVRPSRDAALEPFVYEEDVTEPETLIEWDVLTVGKSIVHEIHDNDSIRLSGLTHSYLTIVSVPISTEGRIIGVLSAMRHGQTPPFDQQNVATLALVGEQVGLAITKVRLLEQVQEQLKALETAIRYKDDFLAALSHELRTPLSAILGFAVMIVENDTMGFMRRREMAGDIVASAVLMRSLVNDLLNLVQIREGQFVIQPDAVDLVPLVDLCLRLLTPLMTVKHQMIVTHFPENLPQIRAERTRLEQVILNLLINANKYMLPEGTITVEAAVDGQFVMLSVHDTGVGVSPEDTERVFELFERGEVEYSRAQGGAGIGLAVSRQIIEAMDGTLTMDSVLGGGSTFTIRLPQV